MQIEVGMTWLVVDRKDGSNYFADDDGSLSGMLSATAMRVDGDIEMYMDEDNFYIVHEE